MKVLLRPSPQSAFGGRASYPLRESGTKDRVRVAAMPLSDPSQKRDGSGGLIKFTAVPFHRFDEAAHGEQNRCREYEPVVLCRPP